MILTYREGCSGSWLAELLLLKNKLPQVYFRQDRTNQDKANFPGDVFHFDGYDVNDLSEIVKLCGNQKIITCHSVNYSELLRVFPNRSIYRITPITGIFNAIASSFFKMHVRYNYSIDDAFQYIVDYYQKYQTDPLPESVIDYGKLKSIDDCKAICKNVFDLEFTNYHELFHKKYWSLQINIVDDSQLYYNISLNKLLELFQDVSNFGIACFIFVYEKYNKIDESRRIWSIDHLPTNIEDVLQILQTGYRP